MSIDKVKKLFEEKPYLLKMGARTIAERFNIDEDLVRQYKELAKRVKKGKDNSPTSLVIAPIKKGPRILILDIETSPMIAYVWSRWKQNIYLDQTIAEWFMICWAGKWLGEDEVISGVLTPEEILKEDDGRISRDLWKLLDEADIVIAHNGKKFDIPKINARFILNGCPPPSFYKQIDTKEVACRKFGFSSNKLDALAGYFGIRHKDDTNFDLWKKCLAGDQEALDYMLKYNIGDILILEKVYLKLRPWITSHPNLSIYGDSGEMKCIACGSEELVEDKFYYSNRNKFRTFRCSCCGTLSRDTKPTNKSSKLSPIPQ